MPIQIQDSFYSESPKPADDKMFVGAADQRLFPAKENIPSQYRFIGMVVFDTDSPYKYWQLQGGIADGNWVDITPSASSTPTLTITTDIQTNATEDEQTFNLPIGSSESNTTIIVNGVHIPDTLYAIVDNSPALSVITFTFGLEAGDTIYAVKYTNI